MGDSPTEKKTPKCPHCPHRLSDPTFRFHTEMLEAISKPTSKPSETNSPSSAESSNTLKSTVEEEKEPNLTHGDINIHIPELDETQEQQPATTSPLPEYLHTDEHGVSHPLHPDLEALLSGKETEILDPNYSSPSHQNPDSEVQALTFIDKNGKVVNVILEGEESDWSTSSVGVAHREICLVCLGVVKRDQGEAKGEEEERVEDGDVERDELKECNMRSGDVGEKRICKGCGEEGVQGL
jgi:hypothetical protein